MKVTTKYVARSTSGCAPFQTYADHALGCARRAAANLPVQKSFAYPAGILHDFGKFQSDVQGHIRGIVPKAEHRGAGMVLIHDTVTNAIKGLQNDSMNVMAMAAGMAVGSHHTGLKLSDNEYCTAYDSSSKNMPLTLKRRSRVVQKMQEQMINDADFREVCEKTCRPGSPVKCGTSLSLFTRMLLSALVDADRSDAAAFEDDSSEINRKEYDYLASLNVVEETNRKKTKGFNVVRNKLLTRCIDSVTDLPGLYVVNAPTGSGKTLSAASWAFRVCKLKSVKMPSRVIFAEPYCAIIDQILDIFTSLFGKENVLAHYGNPVSETNDDFVDYTENWDSPFIITTTVQLFESLFTSKNTKLRKLCKLNNSVIVIDEAHMIPVNLLKPTLMMLDALAHNFGATILLMSATNLDYDKLNVDWMCGSPKVLVNMPMSTVNIINKKTLSLDELAMNLVTNLDSGSVMCIMNRKRSAEDLYNLLKKKVDVPVYYLTTNLCMADRQERLKKIRKEDGAFILVTTSLVEAGVDLDFRSVWREYAGLYHIIQADGRSNREHHYAETFTYVFQLDEKVPAYIQTELNVLKQFKQYDNEIWKIESSDVQEYLIRMIACLRTDKGHGGKSIGDVQKVILDEGYEWQIDFEEVMKRYRVIDTEQIEVLVSRKETAALIEAIESACRSNLKYKVVSKQISAAAEYSVNIYPYQISALSESHGLVSYEIDGLTIYVLNENFYDAATGIKITDEKTYVY